MLNVVVLMGRLTADPELRTSSNGTNYCRFSIAVDRSFVRSGEERKADFFNCVSWGKTAEFISRYFTKGQMIAIQGSLQTGSYTNRDGIKVNTVDINVNEANFTGSKRESGGADQSSYTGSAYQGGGYSDRREQNAPSAPSAPAPTYSSGSADDFIPTPVDEDLPF